MVKLTEIEALYNTIERLQNEIECLYDEKCQLVHLFPGLEIDKRNILKSKVLQKQVNRLVAEEELLLDSVLNAVIEALRIARTP